MLSTDGLYPSLLKKVSSHKFNIHYRASALYEVPELCLYKLQLCDLNT